MSFRLNVKNKVTLNIKTTISVAIRVSSIIGAAIFYHRQEWAFGTASLAVSALPWMRACTPMPFGVTLFAWCGGTAEYEQTPDGKQWTRLSHLPGNVVVDIVLGIAAMAVAAVVILGLVHPAAGATMKTPSRVTQTTSAPGRAGDRNALDPAAVIQMYYAAVNKRDWPTAWRLWGNHPARGPAYRQMISGYRCTVHDWVTEITSNGGSTLARVRALESDGTVAVVQNYWYSYVIQDGLIKEGSSLGETGNPPPGCRQ